MGLDTHRVSNKVSKITSRHLVPLDRAFPAHAQVHATLLDEGTYLCSPRTMYRVLDAAHEIKERRNQVRRPHYAAPELLATRPNAVWSWDITKLRGPATWTYFYLYVILDIFSRYVVGWMIAPRESAVLAERLIADTCAKHGIHPGQLTLHADRGTSMKSKPVALLLADLGVTKTHSRPHVSNDNPFSEAQFKTLKYGPLFPERFGSIADGRAFGQSFFPGYNHEHRHSGLGFLTPAVVHFGQAAPVRAHRQQVLAAAYTAHPERFVNGPPRPADLPTAVWINPPVKKSAMSEFPKWRKYLISLSFRGQSSVRPVQVGGFDVNIVIHRSTAVRGRGGPARHDAWPPSLGAILAHTDGPCGS